jgi:hypothetical protein
MPSELITYTVLAAIFIVTALRMFVEKPGKPSEPPFFRSENDRVDEEYLAKSFEA